MNTIKKIYRVNLEQETISDCFFQYDSPEGVFYDTLGVDGSLSKNLTDIKHLEVPAGENPALYDARYKQASALYSGVTYTASESGPGGNVSIQCDGGSSIGNIVSAWNVANPSNTVSHDGDPDDVPPAGTIVLTGGDELELYLNDTKVLADAKQTLGSAYYNEVYDELYTRFGTRNGEAVSADYETWKLMAETPSDWSSLGLSVTRDTTSFDIGDVLNTDQKVQDYANECIADIKAYGVWRIQRQAQYITDLAAL